MTGYSGTPLAKKLGIKENFEVFVKNSPQDYLELIQPVPEGIQLRDQLKSELDLIHFFTSSRQELESHVTGLQKHIKQNGSIWISWPKKASKVPTDMTEEVIREIVLPLGLVDIKVCAVNEVWSGLKLVIRKELRKK